MADTSHDPRYCSHCGDQLPDHSSRFCVSCGHPVHRAEQDDQDESADDLLAATGATTQLPTSATGPTVRLANAAGEQAVLGGTVRLPTADAVPPGLWLPAEPPGAEDTVAVYAPLRAIVGGWSGLIESGWQKIGSAPARDGTTRSTVRFEIERRWFPAPSGGGGAQLLVRMRAESYAEEGRTRRGFRYQIAHDPPMEVVDARWEGADWADLAVPRIQLMAPPRVKRISDYPEPIGQLGPREADSFARQGQVRGVYRLYSATQQRTLVGRGLPLLEVIGGATLSGLTGLVYALHRVQIRHPLVCRPGEWRALRARIQAEAAGLGLDMESDAVVEWWLERQGHDGAIFERGAHPYGGGRAVIAFRRAQIVALVQ